MIVKEDKNDPYHPSVDYLRTINSRLVDVLHLICPTSDLTTICDWWLALDMAGLITEINRLSTLIQIRAYKSWRHRDVERELKWIANFFKEGSCRH